MLLSFREYARSRGLNVSTVSRQVARRQIPVVLVGGRRLIDPEEADRSRARNLYGWWGGKRTPGVRRAAPSPAPPVEMSDDEWAEWNREAERWLAEALPRLEEELRRLAP